MSDSISPSSPLFNEFTQPPTGKLRCTRCGQRKPVKEFPIDKQQEQLGRRGRSLYQSWCRTCKVDYGREKYDYEHHRDYHLRHKYNGFGLAEYTAMFEAQGGVCACCGRVETERGGRTRVTIGVPIPLAVDHDHKTGEVRALLCHACNQTVGRLNEDPEYARKMYEYLLRMHKNR